MKREKFTDPIDQILQDYQREPPQKAKSPSTEKTGRSGRREREIIETTQKNREVTQKKFVTELSFEFTDHALKYTLKEKGSRFSALIDYSNLPNEPNLLEERNEWFRNVGLIWIVVGLIQQYIVFSSSNSFYVSFWLPLGLLKIVVYQFFRIKYSVFDTSEGRVLVIRDKQHDQIVEELQARRKLRLLELCGEIDFKNDAEDEIRKFKWLHSEGVIRDVDLREKIAQIRSFRQRNHKNDREENPYH